MIALAWAVLDVREVFHQLDESRNGHRGRWRCWSPLLHLAAAAVSGRLAGRARRRVKRLIAPLVLARGRRRGAARHAAGGDSGATGDAETPGAAVPAAVGRPPGRRRGFALGSSPPPQTPTLLWFWAPWCEVCNHEAPAIERLAADARGELAVIAIGGRDQAANGPAFVARHRLRTPTVLFDEPMAAWQATASPASPPRCCSTATAASAVAGWAPSTPARFSPPPATSRTGASGRPAGTSRGIDAHVGDHAEHLDQRLGDDHRRRQRVLVTERQRERQHHQRVARRAGEHQRARRRRVEPQRAPGAPTRRRP